MEMENMDAIFVAALRWFVGQHKSQRQFALVVDISPPYLNDILRGRRHGNEETRRKIAQALGYGGSRYEEFLNVGRKELGLPTAAEVELPPGPEVTRYLARARALLEGGGPKAGLLKALLDVVERE